MDQGFRPIRVIVLAIAPAVAAGLAMGVGALVLLGWRFGVTELIRVRPGLAAMQPTVALACVAAGLALWLLRDPEETVWGRRLGLLCAAGVVVLGAGSLVGEGRGISQLVDLLFSPERRPEGMAELSAISLVILGTSLLLLSRPGRRRGAGPGDRRRHDRRLRRAGPADPDDRLEPARPRRAPRARRVPHRGVLRRSDRRSGPDHLRSTSSIPSCPPLPTARSRCTGAAGGPRRSWRWRRRASTRRSCSATATRSRCQRPTPARCSPCSPSTRRSHGCRQRPRVVAEMLDRANVAVAQTTGVEDFIVSDELSSLMIAQLSERLELHKVFDELFDAVGCFVALHPAPLYANPGRPRLRRDRRGRLAAWARRRSAGASMAPVRSS